MNLKHKIWPHNRRALSPIFATVLLAAIVIVMGTTVYYYSSNLTKNATNQYTSTVSSSEQSITERIAFEDIQDSISPPQLTLYILNCGSANNVQINSVFIYTLNNTIVGQPYSGSLISSLQPIYSGTSTSSPIVGNSLNVGQEGYFTVTLSAPLKTGSVYNIELITKSGSSFNYDYTA
jgi:flagellin-like protein